MCGTFLGKTPNTILSVGKCVTARHSITSERLNMCGALLPKTPLHDFQRAGELEAGHNMTFPGL